MINRNLEALAKQLYDYWFVQFDFPDENGRPYKSSGGKIQMFPLSVFAIFLMELFLHILMNIQMKNIIYKKAMFWLGWMVIFT